MILQCKQTFPWGEKTYFIDKIWNNLIETGLFTEYDYYNSNCDYQEKFGNTWDLTGSSYVKPHTIRPNKAGRWKNF